MSLLGDSINPKMTQTLQIKPEAESTPPMMVYVSPELDQRMQNPDEVPPCIHIVPCDLTIEGVHYTIRAIESLEDQDP